MKKVLLSIVALAIFNLSYAQEFQKMDKSVLDVAYYPTKAPKRGFAKTDEEKKAQEPKIRVLYSRPLTKGRTIFGDLIKYGESWRLGANESTEIMFMTDVMFGGKSVKAGRYTLVAFPNKSEWIIKLNTDLDGWGSYAYDSSKDIANITVPTKKSSEMIEALSMTMYEKSKDLVHLKIGWENTMVELPITLK